MSAKPKNNPPHPVPPKTDDRWGASKKSDLIGDLAEAFPSNSAFIDALVERLAKKTKRSKLFVMRISEAEHEALKDAARDAGVSISDVIRYALSQCLSDGSLTEVAKSHLATIVKVSKPDRRSSRARRSKVGKGVSDNNASKIKQDLEETIDNSDQ